MRLAPLVLFVQGCVFISQDDYDRRLALADGGGEQLDDGGGDRIELTWWVDFEVAEAANAFPGQVLPETRGSFRVDGRDATEAPVDRPFVLQRFDANGQVGATAMVATGAALPAFADRRPGRARSDEGATALLTWTW